MENAANALKNNPWQELLQIANHLFQARRFNDVLYTIVREIANRIEVLRCSIIFVDERKEIAYVVATHETAEIKRIPLDLKKYPEVVQAVQAGESIFIPNVSQDLMMIPFQEVFRQISLSSVAVHPLIQDRKSTRLNSSHVAISYA